MVVALPPVLNENACLLHGHKFFAVQAFVPETAVEALDKTVLPGLPGSMKEVPTSIASRNERTRREINSGPLSLWITVGTPRIANKSVRFRQSRRP